MNPDFSLIDSNLARAREGLRVLDEVARYILKDEAIFVSLKELRHKLVDFENVFGTSFTVASRLPADMGQKRVVDTEFSRNSLWSVIRSNMGRVLESVRALEEFSKLYAPHITQAAKDMRFTLYRAELAMLKRTPHFYMHTYFSRGSVYAISDSVDDIKWLVTNGAKVVQLRDKASSVVDVAKKVEELCIFIKEFNATANEKVLFILNDYVEFAAHFPVAGLHVGQDVLDIQSIRRQIGSNKIIGRSNQSLEHIKKSTTLGVDYVSIGPVFATPTKADRAPVGLGVVREVAAFTSVPLVAIGGINVFNAEEVRSVGVKNVAVVRGAKDFFSSKAITSYTPSET